MDDHNNHCLVDFEYKQLYGMPGQVTPSLMCIMRLLLRLLLAVSHLSHTAGRMHMWARNQHQNSRRWRPLCEVVLLVSQLPMRA